MLEKIVVENTQFETHFLIYLSEKLHKVFSKNDVFCKQNYRLKNHKIKSMAQSNPNLSETNVQISQS
jgi:hypothetical protein